MSSSDKGGAHAPGEGATHASGALRYCAVYDCTNNHKTKPNLAYFGFPSNKEKIKVWAEKIRRPDIVQACGRVSGYYRICEQHFSPSHISRNGRKRRRLLQNAVPCTKLPHAGPYVHVADAAVPARLQVEGKTLVRSTLEVCEYVHEVPKQKTKKKKAVTQPQPLIAPPVLKGLFSNCNKHLTPSAAEFVQLVARLQTVRDDYNLCVKLLYSSPQAYRLLQASLGLPTVGALHRHYAPHITDFHATLDLLKPRVDRMTDIVKHCTLSVTFIDARIFLYYNITFDRIVGLQEVDGMQSPRVATRAGVVTARGLLTTWAQPVALCYLARNDDTFYPWVETIIGPLHSIGLKVHALVCDPSATPPFRDVTPDQPFFFVGDTKIYVIYDPPRLMKNLLCELNAHDFYFDKGSAKWSDLLEYRRIERHKVLTLTPGLTDASLRVDTVRPRRAAGVLSRALATALAARADHGLLGDSARATASFIIRLNNLYDLLDSTTVKTSSEFKKGLSRDPNQVGFLTYMKMFFKSLKMEDGLGPNKAATKKLSESWQVTIEAVLRLQIDIQPLRPYLLTRNLHLNDSVAERCGRGMLKPTCQQIFTAYKKQFFHDMLLPGKTKIGDLNILLARVVPAATGSQTVTQEVDDIPVKASNYRRLQLQLTQCTLMSTAKHLLQAASRIHGACKLAVDYIKAPPQTDFLRLVQHLDAALTSALSEGARASGVLRELLLDVHALDCDLPCECFPLDYLKRLFFRLRLYILLRHNQIQFKCGEVDLDVNSLKYE